MMWQVIQSWPSITVALLVVYWIAMAIIVITDEREPTETLAWLLVLVAFPLLGLIFYFMFGRNWKKIAQRSPWAREIYALALPTMNRVWDTYSDVERGLMEHLEPKGLAPIIIVELLKAIARITSDEGLAAIIVEQHTKAILRISKGGVVIEGGTVVN